MGTVFEESECRANQKIEPFLQVLDKTQYVDKFLVNIPSSIFPFYFDAGEMIAGERESRNFSVERNTKTIRIMENIIPFRRKGSELVPSFDEKGMAVFYRTEEFRLSRRFQVSDLSYRLGDVVLQGQEPHNENIFYYNDQQLLRKFGIALGFYTNSERPEAMK